MRVHWITHVVWWTTASPYRKWLTCVRVYARFVLASACVFVLGRVYSVLLHSIALFWTCDAVHDTLQQPRQKSRVDISMPLSMTHTSLFRWLRVCSWSTTSILHTFSTSFAHYKHTWFSICSECESVRRFCILSQLIHITTREMGHSNFFCLRPLLQSVYFCMKTKYLLNKIHVNPSENSR